MMRMVTGGVLVFIGAIWVLQGFDVAFAPESFMTGESFWIWAGALAVVVGGGLIWWGLRARAGPSA